MEVVGILWHVLAAIAIVGVVLHLNRQLSEFSERDRLLWTMLLAPKASGRQNLPTGRLQGLSTQVLRFCEKEIARQFGLKQFKIERPTSFDGLDVKLLLSPLWALAVSPPREFDQLDETTSFVFLNGQSTSLTTAAAALSKARLAKLSWQEGQWHFDVS